MRNKEYRMEKCAVCSNETSRKCSGCKRVSYCSTEHQRAHWPKHKPNCCPYAVRTSLEFGRYVVATRNIQPGDIILEETPLAVGPKQATRPVCLGCYKTIDGSYTCSKCKWPLCGPQCESAGDHQPECEVTAACKANISVTQFDADDNQYECITPLRCLMLEKYNPKSWARMMEMETHTDIRKTAPIYHINQVNTVEYLNKCFKIDEDPLKIHRICDLLDVNSFDIKGDGFSIRGVFPEAALLHHTCRPNTQRSYRYDNTGRKFATTMVIRAVVPIRRGEAITNTYTCLLNSTLTRRQHLQENKYFHCSCKRCSDSTELGTHLGSHMCHVCFSGVLSSCDPLDSNADYECDSCGFKIPCINIKNTELLILSEMQNGAEDVKEYERLLHNYQLTLHPKHFINVRIKHALLDLYHTVLDKNNELPSAAARWEELSRDLLSVVQVIYYGESRPKGLIMYYLGCAILKQIKQGENNARLKEAKGILEKSRALLQHEPSYTKEGMLAQNIPKILESINM